MGGSTDGAPLSVLVPCSWRGMLQLAQRMAELQAALEPGRLSKRSKPSTHLLDAEKNRNACQAVRKLVERERAAPGTSFPSEGNSAGEAWLGLRSEVLGRVQSLAAKLRRGILMGLPWVSRCE